MRKRKMVSPSTFADGSATLRRGPGRSTPPPPTSGPKPNPLGPTLLRPGGHPSTQPGSNEWKPRIAPGFERRGRPTPIVKTGDSGPFKPR